MTKVVDPILTVDGILDAVQSYLDTYYSPIGERRIGNLIAKGKLKLYVITELRDSVPVVENEKPTITIFFTNEDFKAFTLRVQYKMKFERLALDLAHDLERFLNELPEEGNSWAGAKIYFIVETQKIIAP